MTDACDGIRLLLPEVALGTATGEERARALSHVEDCAACRHELQSLVEVGDELLALAPTAEPPAGFESRVLERFAEQPVERHRWRRWATVAAALVLAASVGAGAAFLAGRTDRDLAGSYRETLGVAEGRYIAARPLLGTGGEAGYVFGYDGSPSWIFCVVRDGPDGTYDIEITTTGGPRVAGEMEVGSGVGAWHQMLETRLHDVQEVVLVNRATGERLVASW